jgi:hypothetical protein
MRLGVQNFSWHPALKTAMIADNADEDSESDTPDSYSQLMNKVNFRTMAAENADEDSEQDTSGSCSRDPTSDTSMAADDANENSEVDISAPEQTPSPIQKESKKQDGFTYPKASKND